MAAMTYLSDRFVSTNKIIIAAAVIYAGAVTFAHAAGAEIISAYPGPLCDTVEPLISHRRYVPVSDKVNGREIFRIENGSKVSVCGAPVKGWRHISFGEDSTGWVRAEFVR
jgi:hypothetical protein